MAPFKLKFRMGSSRSTSQEHDADPQVNEALLNHHHSTAIGASSSTIDSADCNSLGSMGSNERKSLLPGKANNDSRLGIHNHSATTCMGESAERLSTTLPTTPPPSYEHVLEENIRLANKYDLSQQCQFDATDDYDQQSRRSSISNSGNSIHLSSLEHLSLNSTQCTDPHCQENYGRSDDSLQRQHELLNEQDNLSEYNGRAVSRDNDNNEADYDDADADADNRKESIDSTELLISTRMTAPSSQENQSLVEGCTSSCPQYGEQCDEQCDANCGGSKGANNDFFDPLINHSGYCSNDMRFNDDCQEHSQNPAQAEYVEGQCGSDSSDGWDANQMSNSHSHQQQQQHYLQQQQERALTPEIISNKSSKEIYKDLAKQWGITCKMSDACRCMECQSHYFDCEFDENEHQKTDGGLGAGTPMFISEVMHGSACNIL